LTERTAEATSATRPWSDALRRLERGVDWLFEGTTRSVVYSSLRIGTAAIFLVRHSDWLRPWVFLEHHRFVRGLMFLEPSPLEPRLVSPILSGFALGDGATRALVLMRTALSVLLLFGVRARLSAALLGVVSYLLLLADRYRYYHHLHLLYVSLLFLALAPLGSSLSLEHGVRRAFGLIRGSGSNVAPATASLLLAETPAWPLQLIRALVIGVYLAAGVSKLDASWLDGDALRELERFRVLKGPFWESVRNAVGHATVAKLSLITELALPVALMLRPTRRLAILGGWAFHAGISACMPVYSFGIQMSLFLLAFWPDIRTPDRQSMTDTSPSNTRISR
jgi:hypothetical protein